KPHVAAEEERAEVDPRPEVLVKEIQHIPADDAVAHEDLEQPEPWSPRERVRAGIDDEVVDQRGRGDAHESQQAHLRDDACIEPTAPRALAAPSLGLIDLQIQRTAEIHAEVAAALYARERVRSTVQLRSSDRAAWVSRSRICPRPCRTPSSRAGRSRRRDRNA